MSRKQTAQSLLEYIESNNTHGRKTLLSHMETLGLKKSMLYGLVQHSSTNIGKNQLKSLWLEAFIEQL